MLPDILIGSQPAAGFDERNRQSIGGPGVLAGLRRAVEDPLRAHEPRYLRLRAAILEMLAQGRLTSGDKLPSETELARGTGLSLGTVQKTLAHLATDEILVRRHGHGTFVPGDAGQPSQLIHFRFIGEDGRIVAPVYAEAISRKLVRSKGPWSEFLKGSKSFIQIRRRINVGDEFDCLSDFYIDTERLLEILDVPLQDLYRTIIRNTLAVRFKAPTLQVSRRIYASRFSDGVGRLLKLPLKSNFGLVLAVSSSTHNREPISFQNIFVPSGVRPLEFPPMRLT